MRGDESSRSRATLLARWRGAAGRVRQATSPSSPRGSAVAEEAPAAAEEPEAVALIASSSTLPVAAPVAALPAAPSAPEAAPLDETSQFRRFEEEILRVVPRPTADALCRLLAAPRDALLRERSEENRAQMLAQLDLIEDVLDAALLAGTSATQGEDQGSA